MHAFLMSHSICLQNSSLKQALLTTKERDEACRYLGAWYQSDGKWGRQRQILKAKLDELADD